MGTFIYYLLWPAIWFYSPLRLRVGVIVVANGQILEVKNWLGPNKWHLPGGGLKLHENIKKAAMREIKEEVGIDISKFEITQLTNDVLIIKTHGLLTRNHILKVNLSEVPDLTPNKEITDYRWTSIDDSNLPIEIKNLI